MFIVSNSFLLALHFLPFIDIMIASFGSFVYGLNLMWGFRSSMAW